MGLSDVADEGIYAKYIDLCNDLNMDKNAADEAWQSYENIQQHYTLEGDQVHWLCCALYEACRKSTPPTVGMTGTLVEGNLVSLTRLLRLCNLSLIQFFNKSKKWSDMASLPPEFRCKIDRLERNFAVSMVIFKKFQPIFCDMFGDPATDPPRHKSKKQSRMPCTASQVFEFTWTLFVCVKADFPDISDDLVSSYHLLLACCDLIFANAILSDRKDLLNPKFQGLPLNFCDKDFSPPSEPPCVIYDLCQKHDGILIEAKGIKEYYWRNHIKKLFIKKVLKGHSENFSELLETSNFEINLKAINRTYEEYVLSVGDFDERIFLGDNANNDIGTPTKTMQGEITEQIRAKRNLNSQVGGMQHLAPATPLTGRKYLLTKDSHSVTPVSTATQSVSRLQLLLSGRQAKPSDALTKLIGEEKAAIESRVQELGEQFCVQYTQKTEEHAGSNIDFAQKRLLLAVSLYYKLLENILTEEMKKSHFDLKGLIIQDIFHQTMFACCLEIVIYSYNSQRTFPWVLEALNIEPYHFYKVIEVIVRAEDQLSRDMVKHLNLIEEQILESLAWRRVSPLWESVEKSGLPVPSCEDVSLPGQLVEHCQATTLNPAKRRLANLDTKSSTLPSVTQSPGSSASERFQSPVAVGKRRLFMDLHGTPVAAARSVVKPGQSLLQGKPGSNKVMMNIPTIETQDGKMYIPIQFSPKSGNIIIQSQPKPVPKKEPSIETQQERIKDEPGKDSKKPKRLGSLGLFFRKFYHLASVRMQELCNQLGLKDTELRRKIWTCFEHSIVEHTELMLDRHLDQILMCAVYVICKIVGPEQSFTEVMRCYRLQPQCQSHVYRSVLLTPKNRPTSSTVNVTPTTSTSDSRDGTGRESSAPSHVGQAALETEERGDLIKFYNYVYVKKIQSLAVKFTSQSAAQLTLSPLPVGKSTPMSPRRRVSERHSVYIRALQTEAKGLPQSPSKPLSYCFSRSPAKDLRAINSMLQVEPRCKGLGKRLLREDDATEAPPTKVAATATGVINRKMQDLLGDRMVVAKGQE